MRKVFTGEGRITPYRPWSEERLRKRREQIADSARRMGMFQRPAADPRDMDDRMFWLGMEIFQLEREIEKKTEAMREKIKAWGCIFKN